MSIRNARIVSEYTLPCEYQAEVADRGTPGFTLRASCLSEILRNARRWKNGYVSPDSEAKEFGELYDCLLLTPKQYCDRFAIVPDDAPRRPSDRQRNAKKPSPETLAAIKWWDDFNARTKGCRLIDQDTNGSVHSAINTLRMDELISDLIASAKVQVWIAAEWEDPTTGLKVPLKCLIDVVPSSEHPLLSNALMDVKTTRNASPHSFARDAYKYGYHRAGALYLDLWNAATGEIRGDFGHIVQESFPPYEFRSPPPLLSQRFINLGRIEYQLAISIYCRSVASGVWPDYDKRSKEWPITDCEDWMLSLDRVLPPMEEEEEAEEPQPEAVGVTP